MGGVNETVKLEGVKAIHEADMSAMESCWGKCKITTANNSFEKTEDTCLRKCYIKYFDSALLVQKEMRHYTQGIPLV